MKVTNSFTSIFTTVALLGSFVAQAAPTVGLPARDVYVPHITSPKAGDVWYSGKKAQVTWDTSNPPKQITNKVGWVLLRENNRGTPVVLADKFNILDGKVSFDVPLVITGNDYSITLFGDSGNWSSNFTIKGHDLF